MQNMKNIALRNTLTLFVLSAFGFLARWGQNANIFDPKTGLATSGATSSFILIALSIIVVSAFAVLLRPQRNFYLLDTAGFGIVCEDIIYKIISRIGAILLIAGGILMMLSSKNYMTVAQLIFILGGLSCVAGVAVLYISSCDCKSENIWVASILPTIFLCLWLITSYKLYGTDPVVWKYAVEIIAIAAATEATFLVAGFAFGKAQVYLTLLFCYGSAFFLFMSLGDTRAVEFQLCIVGMAMYLVASAFSITLGIKRK